MREEQDGEGEGRAMTDKEKLEQLKSVINRTPAAELTKQLREVQSGRSDHVTITTVDGKTYRTKAVLLKRVGSNLVEVPTKPAKK